MKAFVFSIGEKTTDLCCELMREYGYEVILYQDQTSLWEKLKRFYTEALATSDEAFIRIDADIIPYWAASLLSDTPWTCASGFDWYKQDIAPISIHYMTRDVIELCNANIESAKNKIRPETHLWRLPEINMQTSIDDSMVFGLHGYGQQDQRERIKKLKQSRDQEYDWSLVEKIEALK